MESAAERKPRERTEEYQNHGCDTVPRRRREARAARRGVRGGQLANHRGGIALWQSREV